MTNRLRSEQPTQEPAYIGNISPNRTQAAAFDLVAGYHLCYCAELASEIETKAAEKAGEDLMKSVELQLGCARNGISQGPVGHYRELIWVLAPTVRKMARRLHRRPPELGGPPN